MARVNVYIPDALRNAMHRYEREHPEVNWSRHFRAAVVIKLRELGIEATEVDQPKVLRRPSMRRRRRYKRRTNIATPLPG